MREDVCTEGADVKGQGRRAAAEVCTLAGGQLALRGTEHDDLSLRLLRTLRLFTLLLKETAEAPSTSRRQSIVTEILIRGS